MLRTALISTIVIAVLLAATGCASLTNPNASLLDPGDPDAIGNLTTTTAAVNREIAITPATRWVNVSQYEVIKFTHTTTGRSFAWRFAVRRWVILDLSAVAPQGAFPPGQRVLAYISEFQLGGLFE